MPKKFVGENSKAVAAKARKNAAKEEEVARKKKQEEDEYWRDDDKNILKKQQKKDEREKKRLEQLERKKEADALLEKELNSIKVNTATKPPPKITRASIQTGLQKKKELEEKATSEPLTHIETPLIENVNRLEVEGDEARTVEEAIKVLSVSGSEPVDMHPEKRMKAAWTAFEAENLQRLKIENPTLRLSQVKQLLRKEWMKSPSNPSNQI
ncbi:hypothetical protein M8J76_015744 [Diaphorina citri]|nr:hypothetical protein M8J76_015744 [Diaphorina citri]